ncbi:MAG: SWIM zinc finger family protein, partial [Candidatus Hodarchaeales archaeon]
MTIEFTERMKEGERLVQENRVKKYLIDEKIERWIVVGNRRDYLVMINPLWCSCYDFQHSVLANKNIQCKHSL